jgi:hypothetical protein
MPGSSAPRARRTLQAITTINSATFAAPLAGSRQAVSAVAADYSVNSDRVRRPADHRLHQRGGWQRLSQAAGDGHGRRRHPAHRVGRWLGVEIDDMLKSMWDNYRISPTVIYVNSQELKSITKLVLTNSHRAAAQVRGESNDERVRPSIAHRRGIVSFYFNPYTADGGMKIPVKIHPNRAAGHDHRLGRAPARLVRLERDAAGRRDADPQGLLHAGWPKVTRQQDYGVYAQEALACTPRSPWA